MDIEPALEPDAQAVNAAPADPGPPDNSVLAGLLATAMAEIAALRQDLAAVKRDRSGGRDPEFVIGEGRADRARRRGAKAQANGNGNAPA